jgi:hypothetical protein
MKKHGLVGVNYANKHQHFQKVILGAVVSALKI